MRSAKIAAFVVALVILTGQATRVMGYPDIRLSYQGRLTDTNGAPIADGSPNMRFDICTDSACATSVWNETQAVTTTDGLFSAILGGTSAIALDFNSTAYWLQVTVGGTAYTPTQRIAVSAMAVNADLLDGQHGAYYMPASTDNWVNVTGDTMTGALTMSGAAADVIFDNTGGAISNTAGDVTIDDNLATTGTIAASGAISSSSTVTGTRLISTIAIGTAPLGVTSTTVVTNLNADLLDGLSEASFFRLSQNETVTGLPSFNGGTSGSTAPFYVDSTFLVTNLNADLLDGKHYADLQTDFDASYVNVGGDTMTGALNMTADVIPTVNSTYNLGSAALKWSTLNIANGGLTDGAVLLADLATDSVNSAKIVDASVALADMAADSVNSSKIVDLSVATGDVAFNFLGGLEGVVNKGGNIDLAAGNALLTITANDTTETITLTVNNGSIDHGGLAGLADDDHTQYVLDAGDTMTGTLNSRAVIPTVDNTYALGSVALKWSALNITQGGYTDSSVVSADINDGTVALADMAADSVNSSKIVDLSVATGDVGFNFVGSLDGVVNKGGNIDLASGNAMLTITPNDTTDTITLTVNNGSVDHGTLAGLGDDDHTQYFALAQSEIVTGVPAFNGGDALTAPFTVDSNFKVTSLNADLLDGNDSAYFLNTGTAFAGEVAGTYGALLINCTGCIGAAEVADNSLTATDLNVNVVSSVDGVTNDGGNVDFLAGTGITITPDDVANTITITATPGGIDHGGLLGLGDDDHPQYFALAQNEIVTGVPAFNGGTTGSAAPFSVDSTYVVASLNADLLDGQEGAYYMPASTDNWVNISGDTMTGDLVMGNAATVRVDFFDDVNEKILLYGAAGAVGTYSIGVESSTQYFKSGSLYRWYIGTNADGGTSDKMELDTDSLNLGGKETIRYSDGWLRLNQNNDYTSGVYTPYLSRADGGFNIDGNTTVDAAGTNFYSYGLSTNKWGSGASASGWGLDALNSGDWDLLVYESQAYTENLKLGYGGTTSVLSTYDANEALSIQANGSGNLNLLDAGTGNIVAYRNVYPSADNSFTLGRDPLVDGASNAWSKVNLEQGIEARWNVGTPYLDFSNDETSDYDARFILTANDNVDLSGSGLSVYGPTFVGSTSANTNIKFTDAWSGYPDTNTTRSEISNDTVTYKTLMIIGNKSNDGSTRRVSVWDRLEVNGTFYVSGQISTGSTGLVTNLNADLHDGYHAGNANGNMPISNGTVNTNLNADMTDGFHASTTRNSANTMVVRDANGYTQLGWINTDSGVTDGSAIGRVYASTTSDNYVRYYTPGGFTTAMDYDNRYKCEIKNFTVAAGTTSCTSGKAVVGCMMDNVTVGPLTKNRILQNPSAAQAGGATVDGWMICCPVVSFP